MLIITNPGLVDPMAFHLIGASSKRNDQHTIGFFGSGLKYSIAGLLRKNIPLQVWRGTEFMDITTEEVTMRDNTYKRIVIDGVNQRPGKLRQRQPAAGFGDAATLVGTTLLVDARDASGQRRQIVVVGAARSDVFQQRLQRHAGVLFQRLGIGQLGFADADAVDDQKVRLGLGIGRDRA